MQEATAKDFPIPPQRIGNFAPCPCRAAGVTAQRSSNSAEMSVLLDNNKDVHEALRELSRPKASEKEESNTCSDSQGSRHCPASVKGQVVRRRPRSKRLVFLDVALDRNRDGTFVMAFELAADVLGGERTVQLRHDVRPGDVVVGEGNLRLPPPTGSKLYIGELKCTSLTVHEKWDSQRGPFVPHMLDQSLEVDDDVAANCEKAHDDEAAEIRKQDTDPLVSLCKAWINTGKCLTGASCKFRHSTLGESLGKARATWVQERRKARMLLPSTAGDTVTGQEKEAYKERARVFCAWLEQTFGAGVLQQGVIDVAGGRGDLSFELTLVRGFPSVVVDPRPIRFNKRQHREVEGMIAANALPDPEAAAAMLKACRAAGGKGACKCAQTLMQQRQGYFNADFLAGDSAELVAGAGVLVGLHPDEATDAIVDAALRLRKPFAIIPCCVFSLQNPHRRLASGAAASSYEDYVEWLAGRHPSIQRAFLPFAGKNQVLYSRGFPEPSTPPRSTEEQHPSAHEVERTE